MSEKPFLLLHSSKFQKPLCAFNILCGYCCCNGTLSKLNFNSFFVPSSFDFSYELPDGNERARKYTENDNSANFLKFIYLKCSSLFNFHQAGGARRH